MAPMKTSVVIVTYNAPVATTRAALSAVPSAEDVCVIDNGSPMGRITVPDGVDLVRLNPARGLAACWNRAVLGAAEDWVVIANDDVVFDEDWLEKLAATLAECPNALHIGMAYPQCSYSAFAIHKSLVERIGWFDERFVGIFCEDDDWHLRMCEHANADVARAWAAGRRDLVFAMCPAIKHTHDLRDKDAGCGGLSKVANHAWFGKKWAIEPGGWWTKGLTIHGRYTQMARAARDIDPYRRSPVAAIDRAALTRLGKEHGRHNEAPFLEALCEVVLRANAQTVVEIGTGWFTFSRAILHGLAATGGRLCTCDPEPKEQFAHRQMAALRQRSDDVAAKWKEPIDVLMLDGDHAYEQVKRDYENFEPFVRDGGFIALHDITHPWAHNAGPGRLWAELKAAGANVYLERIQRPGFGVLQK